MFTTCKTKMVSVADDMEQSRGTSTTCNYQIISTKL